MQFVSASFYLKQNRLLCLCSQPVEHYPVIDRLLCLCSLPIEHYPVIDRLLCLCSQPMEHYPVIVFIPIMLWVIIHVSDRLLCFCSQSMEHYPVSVFIPIGLSVHLPWLINVGHSDWNVNQWGERSHSTDRHPNKYGLLLMSTFTVVSVECEKHAIAFYSKLMTWSDTNLDTEHLS